MSLTTKIMTLNDCYKSGRKITPKGIMVHTTATPGVMAQRWFDLWNKPNISKCVHAFVDDVDVMQYLPWNHRGWHAGGAANGTHIGFEICEPKSYNKDYFDKAYNNAVELATYLCKQYGLTENDIIGHYEGGKLGIASNHADPKPFFSAYGKSMDTFRSDVKERLNSIQEVKGVSITVKNLVVYGNSIDRRAAEYLADYLQCPTLDGNIPYDYSNVENVYCVGGAPNLPWTGYAKKIIAGNDRYDTMVQVLKFIGRI